MTTTNAITVPDEVLDAVAARLEAAENPDRTAALDLLHDHVQTTSRFVTADGSSAVDELLDRVGAAVDVPLDDETLEVIDVAAARAGEDRLEWIRGAARERIGEDADGVALEYDEDTPEPIDVGASAELDYAADPERPLSIELAIPADIVGDDDLDDVLAAVSIDVRLVGEAE